MFWLLSEGHDTYTQLQRFVGEREDEVKMKNDPHSRVSHTFCPAYFIHKGFGGHDSIIDWTGPKPHSSRTKTS